MLFRARGWGDHKDQSMRSRVRVGSGDKVEKAPLHQSPSILLDVLKLCVCITWKKIENGVFEEQF